MWSRVEVREEHRASNRPGGKPRRWRLRAPPVPASTTTSVRPAIDRRARARAHGIGQRPTGAAQQDVQAVGQLGHRVGGAGSREHAIHHPQRDRPAQRQQRPYDEHQPEQYDPSSGHPGALPAAAVLWHKACQNAKSRGAAVRSDPHPTRFAGVKGEPMADNALVFEVEKSDWKRTRFVEGPVPELAPGQVLFRVDRFALTANNITYAVFGDLIGYWRFFPSEAGWGRIPVMGFADVLRSTHPGVKEGTRCFGFYPMARHAVIQPGVVSESQIVDASPHRAGLAAPYAQYRPTTGDDVLFREREDAILLMRGLFMTAFLADDFLGEQDYRGARAVLISSASSKTSIALAFQLKQGGRARAIGLTSARNAEFVRSLGYYDQVVLYDEIASLAKQPAVFVDMAGDGAVTAAVHRHFADALQFDCAIGATHWAAERSNAEPAGSEARVLLRARADREAQQGLGTGRAVAAHRRGLDEVLRRERRLAARGARRVDATPSSASTRTRLRVARTRPTDTSSRSEETGRTRWT